MRSIAKSLLRHLLTAHMSLAWNVDELSCLNQQGRKLVIEVSVIKNKLNDISDLVSNNVTRQLTRLQQSLLDFLKGI